MFKRILVPLDGSETAERALEPAFEVAQGFRSTVILLRVAVYKQIMVPSPGGYGLLLPEQSQQRCRAEAIDYLDGIRESKRDAGLRMRSRVEDGDPAGHIVDTAVNEEAQLIVMTTHGYSGFTRWMLGSVTERVLHEAPCPVLVVRQPKPIQRTVITLDGSRLAEQALEPGLELARVMGSRVTLLQANHTEDLGAVESGLLEMAGAGSAQQLRQELGARPEVYLGELARQQQSAELQVDYVVVDGPPASGILDYVERQDVDLVVMATHGRTGLRRWIYGSVTEKVLHKVECAMLVVRPNVG